MRWPIVLCVLTLACRGGRDDEARALVQNAWQQLDVTGAVGTELLGKGIWYEGPALDAACAPAKELGWMDDEAHRPSGNKLTARISPTYDAQRYFTYSTPRGFCLYLGDDLSMEITGVTHVMNVYGVQAKYDIRRPEPWWDCVRPSLKDRQIDVIEQDNGKLEIQTEVGLFRGDCPAPLPRGEQRRAKHRPTGKAPQPATMADVKMAAKRLDDALWAQDYEAALTSISCFNFFEEKPYGTCSVAELVNVGPLPRSGQERGPKYGVPWSDWGFTDLDSFDRIVPDKEDGTLFHVLYKHRRTKDTRSISVHWAEGGWKLVGVVSIKGEGLTSVRFAYDLHDKDRRSIFDLRYAGEQVDDYGEPLDAAVRWGVADPD